MTDIWGTGPDSPVVSGGTYQVKLSSGQAMDDPGSSTARGTQLIVWPATTGANQKWTFTANGDGTYQLKNQASGLCADDSDASTAPGSKIIQWTCNGNANQHWSVVPSGSGYALVNQRSGLAVTAGAAGSGSPLTQQAGTGGSLQSWTFTQAG
ncbi:RICIN domain-containing protein [Kitasatospora sp. NA04385]|uniref:RICIN domain-containing protein n=1 Tax=Kitasatospora sp. NA04385 TaxID=2742135 RepID=UPI0026DFA78C|nr:RICIN domain-containing protein [Kitasatospora sp. NA04385]